MYSMLCMGPSLHWRPPSRTNVSVTPQVAIYMTSCDTVLKGKGPNDVLVKELTDLVLPQLQVRESTTGYVFWVCVHGVPIAASAHLLARTHTPKMAVQ